MERSLQISARHFELPTWATKEIEHQVERLEEHFPRMIGCHVVVDGPSAHHQKGGDYAVTLDMRLPGGEPLVVSKQADPKLDAAISHAFKVALRRLEDYSQRLRGDVKRHDPVQ